MSVNLAQSLQLLRPLTVFDVETTGVSWDNDRIIQISVTKHSPSKDPIRWTSLVNPSIPVPVEIQRIHGITDEALAGAPTFKSLAADLARTAFTGVDFAGHGVTFDLKMFRAECRRAGVEWDWEKTDAKVIDTLRIRQITMPNDLSTVYEDITGQKLTNAHDAGADVIATEIVLAGQLSRHTKLPRTVTALADFCWPKKTDAVDAAGKFVWRNGKACLAFGKFSGRPLDDPSVKDYLAWMLRGDFPPETKDIVKRALSGEMPVKETQ